MQLRCAGAPRTCKGNHAGLYQLLLCINVYDTVALFAGLQFGRASGCYRFVRTCPHLSTMQMPHIHTKDINIVKRVVGAVLYVDGWSSNQETTHS